ncbi:MAG: hypothetical protein LBU18_01585 [Treponema sp.]|jgi:hypothetical protein|nr:hypothetical protein [Treponema sp.]
MCKFLFYFLLAAALMAASCNFSIPERAHIKAKINPNFPVNSETFSFSKNFKEGLEEVFQADQPEEKFVIFDYQGDEENIQKFMIDLPLQEQSLDFKKYLSEDLDLNSKFGVIKQTFTMSGGLSTDAKISIDMTEAQDSIVAQTDFSVFPAPIPLAGMNSTVGPVSVPTTGFRSLTFYDGSIVMKISTTGGALIHSMKLNDIDADIDPTGEVTGVTNEITATFPLKDKTLVSGNIELSFTYNAPASVPSSPSGLATMTVKDTKLEGARIKTAEGVNLGGFSNKDVNETLNFDMPSEFVQAIIEKGSLSFEAKANGFDINISGITVSQAANESAPEYGGRQLNAGLSISNLSPGVNELAGQFLNSKEITIGGQCAAEDQHNVDLSFDEKGGMEIPVAFKIEKFKSVYINGQTIIDNFKANELTAVEVDLGSLGRTVTKISINETGVLLHFGKSSLEGLFLEVNCTPFHVFNREPVEEGDKRFTNRTKEGPSDEREGFDFDLSNPENKKIRFDIELEAGGGSSVPVLELNDIVPGEEVTVIDCTPEVIFDWEYVEIDPGTAEQGSGSSISNGFSSGVFPKTKSFDLKESDDLTTILADLAFEHDAVKGYLVLTGPPLEEKPKMYLTMNALYNDADPNAADNPTIGTSETHVSFGTERLILSDESQGAVYTKTIAANAASGGSVNGPYDFTPVFNNLIGGLDLRIKYKVVIPKIKIYKETLENTDVKIFRADLIIIVPLTLAPKTDDNNDGANIDLTGYMGDMIGSNLLGFTEDTGNAAVTFNTAALNIGLSGTPIEKGEIRIKRDTAKDGGGEALPDLEPIKLDDRNIALNLSDYLGSKQSFTITNIALHIAEDGRLNVPKGLSLLSINLNAGVDVTYEF